MLDLWVFFMDYLRELLYTITTEAEITMVQQPVEMTYMSYKCCFCLTDNNWNIYYTLIIIKYYAFYAHQFNNMYQCRKDKH